ncbi:hypothetical protein ACFE04_001078 [Oxalis oulophora]
MAEISSALCLSPSSSSSSSSSTRIIQVNASSLPFTPFTNNHLPFTNSPNNTTIIKYKRRRRHPRVRFSAQNSSNFFPWSQDDHDVTNSSIEWVQEDKITLFTADGLVQIGGSLVPKHLLLNKKQGRSKQRFQRFKESDYMDPNQSLCLGALFHIAATNGLDMGRRLCILGFCRSVEMLSDVVEDTVLEHGGEIVAAEKASKGGLHEKLSMTVAVPYLWGVPPASETLHLAVQSGGGIVEKVYWQWDFL